jgi:hypothetical protein
LAAQKKGNNDILAAQRDFEAEVKKIHDAGNQDRENAARDSVRRISDIMLGYKRDVEDINLRANERQLELDIRHRDDEISAEKKFEEKMLELRERYLFDLEDAVRVRDARKVLDLNRKYNLDREQAYRQFNDDKADREQRYEFDKMMIERNRQLDLQERARRLKQDMIDAQTDLKRKLEDIRRGEDEKLKILLASFAKERLYTAANCKAVYDILAKYYGPGGMIEGLYKYYTMMAQAAMLVQQMQANIPRITQPTTPSISPVWQDILHRMTNYAEGGTVIATKPTAAIFGERGPEKATFEPLTRTGANVGKIYGGNAESFGGKAVIAVSLSEGLEARIVDNTLGAVASVVLTSEG